ncbi:hypothetical protein VULLAG_LOCUS23003 [Vulpes lagopus]
MLVPLCPALLALPSGLWPNLLSRESSPRVESPGGPSTTSLMPHASRGLQPARPPRAGPHVGQHRVWAQHVGGAAQGNQEGVCLVPKQEDAPSWRHREGAVAIPRGVSSGRQAIGSPGSPRGQPAAGQCPHPKSGPR